MGQLSDPSEIHGLPNSAQTPPDTLETKIATKIEFECVTQSYCLYACKLFPDWLRPLADIQQKLNNSHKTQTEIKIKSLGFGLQTEGRHEPTRCKPKQYAVLDHLNSQRETRGATEE